MPALHPGLARADAFCKAYNLRVPILLAPMAGACPPSLSIAVANAGGLGACGALFMQPDAIHAWASQLRAGSKGGFQVNLCAVFLPADLSSIANSVFRFVI